MVEKRFEESRSRSPKDCVHRGLGLRLNPRRTQFCVLETLEKSSSYAILQIAKWASTPVLFRFSRHGERIVSKNPIYIAVEDDFEGPSPEEIEELSEIEKKWAEKYPPKKSQE